MFVLVFVCLTFDSRNIALIARERTVQPKLYSGSIQLIVLCHAALACRQRRANLPPRPPAPTHPVHCTQHTVHTDAKGLVLTTHLMCYDSGSRSQLLSCGCCINQTLCRSLRVSGRGISRLSGGLFWPVLFWIQLTRRHGHLKYMTKLVLPTRYCCTRLRRHSDMTSAQLTLRIALTVKPGQSHDVGGRLSWVLG